MKEKITNREVRESSLQEFTFVVIFVPLFEEKPFFMMSIDLFSSMIIKIN
jgi:hypothetical protein